MDPQLKSLLTSVLLASFTSAAVWAANRGLIPSEDQSVIANDLVTFVLGGGAAILTWYKAREHSPSKQIEAVNKAKNGVKVVPESSPTPAISGPLESK